MHQINITVSGFLVTGLIPKGVQQVELPFQHITEEEATPSQPIIKEEEQAIEVLDSEDEFEVFNQLQSLEPPTGDFSHFPPVQASSNQEATGIPDAKVHNTRLRRVSWSFWSTTRGVMRPRWPFKPNPPLFHLPKPFKLTLLIKRENATLRERKLWRKGGGVFPQKK